VLASQFQAWIEEMANFLKSLDGKHMVTVGEEGFFPDYNGQHGTIGRRLGGWSTRTGQDFVRNHAPASIDYTTTHIWPDNWGDASSTNSKP
jgi:mannan endo-1,4-beta-mannosidase